METSLRLLMSLGFGLLRNLMVTIHFPALGADADAIDIASILEAWNQYFGSSHRVYEKQHPFPGLIVNYEDGADDEDRNPSWLSRMFEYGFLRLIKLTNHVQISQFPQIIQQVVRKIKSPFVSIRCWSTLPRWDGDNWMTIQPSHHLVLIDGYTHNGPWYDVILSLATQILWLSYSVGQTTSTMKSEMSPVNYGKITTL